MKKSLLPKYDFERIEYAFKQGMPDTDWELVQILRGGLSGASLYKVKANDNFYVVKLDKPDDRNIDLARCYRVLKIASEAALAPTVYFCESKHGIVLMKYIEPMPMPIPCVDSVKRFAKKIKKMHNGVTFENWKSIHDILENFHKKISIETRKLEVMRHCIDECPYLKKLLSDPADIKPSHSDLNPGNVLFDGVDYVFVDWLSASPQNLYFDLATCTQFFFLTSEELSLSLLRNYFEREPDQDELDKYYLMRIFINIYYGIIFISTSQNEDHTLRTFSASKIQGLPGFAEYHAMIGSGKVNLASAENRQQFGFIFLNNALLEIKSVKYNELSRNNESCSFKI